MTTKDNINEEIFKSMGIYLFFLLIFILSQIYVIMFAYLSNSVTSIAIELLFTILFFRISLRYQYKVPVGNKYIGISIILSGLFYYGFLNHELELIMSILRSTLPIVVLHLLPLSSCTYKMKLEYNLITEILTIRYKKIFTVINETYKIPRNATLNLMTSPKLRYILFRKGLFYRIRINHKQLIYIAPLISGFELPNKLMDLFQPSSMIINVISNTNAALVLPKPNILTSITIPKSGTLHPFHNLEIIKNIINNVNFKTLTPKIGKKARIQPIFIIILFVFILTYGISALIVFYPVLITQNDKILLIKDIYQYVNLILLLVITLIALVLTVSNTITVWHGTLSLILSNNSVKLNYNFKNFKKVGVKIHRCFNPLINIHNNIIYLIILDDKKRPFYEHRIGILKEDLFLESSKSSNLI